MRFVRCISCLRLSVGGVALHFSNYVFRTVFSIIECVALTSYLWHCLRLSHRGCDPVKTFNCNKLHAFAVRFSALSLSRMNVFSTSIICCVDGVQFAECEMQFSVANPNRTNYFRINWNFGFETGLLWTVICATGCKWQFERIKFSCAIE